MARTKHIARAGYLSKAQAIQYLGLPAETFRQLVKRHGIPSMVERGAFIYREEDIEALARINADEQ